MVKLSTTNLKKRCGGALKLKISVYSQEGEE